MSQEWVGEASVLCAAGRGNSGDRHWLPFKLYPDRCIPLSYPDLNILCAATRVDDHTLQLTATYRFSSAPPYRRPWSDCGRNSWMMCRVDAPPPGNYVVKLGELALPITVGYGSGVGPCTNGEDH